MTKEQEARIHEMLHGQVSAAMLEMLVHLDTPAKWFGVKNEYVATIMAEIREITK